jgi:hypothetical protein
MRRHDTRGDTTMTLADAIAYARTLKRANPALKVRGPIAHEGTHAVVTVDATGAMIIHTALPNGAYRAVVGGYSVIVGGN